jgi:hypothetical protein
MPFYLILTFGLSIILALHLLFTCGSVYMEMSFLFTELLVPLLLTCTFS